MITGAAQMDGAILVARRPTARCRRRASTSFGAPGRRSGAGGVPEQGDQVDDAELLELVELEVRELLSSYDFPGDDVPIVKGSALAALEDSNKEIGEDAVPRADEAGRRLHPDAERPINLPFLMPIEDVFSISGRARGDGAVSSAAS